MLIHENIQPSLSPYPHVIFDAAKPHSPHHFGEIRSMRPSSLSGRGGSRAARPLYPHVILRRPRDEESRRRRKQSPPRHSRRGGSRTALPSSSPTFPLNPHVTLNAAKPHPHIIPNAAQQSRGISPPATTTTQPPLILSLSKDRAGTTVLFPNAILPPQMQQPTLYPSQTLPNSLISPC